MPEDLKDMEKMILEARKAESSNAEPEVVPDAVPDDKGAAAAPAADFATQLAEKQAEIDHLRRQVAERNVDFKAQIADLKEREEEVRQALAELKLGAADGAPATQLSRGDKLNIEQDELVNTPEFADYLIFRIAAERRDRNEPGYSKDLFARVAAEEKKAGALAGYRIPGVTV